MKKILSMLAAVLLVAISGYSQSPGFFNYQGVARNSVGNVLKNQNIGIRLTVRDGSSGGTVVYQESRTAVTNPFGLFNVQVGSAGATNVTGTILGVNWSVGSKYIQVEVDPAGGTNFINIGTAQLASVPYSLYATTSGDMVLPFNKTQADAGSLFKITNSGTGAGSTSLEGVTNSTAGNAAAVKGIVSSVSPGGFSTGVLGQNNGTGGLGIGVTGTQAGSGWGVYGVAPAGIGVNGSSNTGIGVNGTSTSGTGGRFTTTSGLALHTTGGVRFQGIGEAASRVLGSDASGNATWQTVAALGAVTGSGTLNLLPKWTPSGTVLGNSLLFDDGNSVALGTTAPTHRFTVSHGGSTGIGVSSTSGFSVVDINAASGDAALRFGNAGVNQWNMRNRPGDNYLEWFELGGGGSRMVIQDGTGNVGIGETANPSYKLDVLHGGSTGIRSRSSGSFSVVDIDAASGDAALRFAKAGVNQWNIRNRPADDYLEIFELGGGGSRMVIQDATGNVGIGETTAPSYKLDVLHGGSTGIRSRSSSSFSVVDIDAESGDAALRFAKAGVNQWNTRNRPADDYYEIFELGGGGSRFVIQDGTGNVGIGETTAPSYKLDVLHGGSTGIRSRSSSSFSVVDIDGQSGDAALRFQKAGVNMWNTRNNPGTDDYQIFELGGGGERLRIENTTGRVVVNGDFTAIGVKAFTMDHPLDPANKTLMHAAVESNEVLNAYSGNVVTDASGKATVKLPDYFEAINKDFRYQLTVIGSFAQAIINKEVSNNQFEIATSQPNVKVSWEVKGVRNDAHMQKTPFVAEQMKPAAQRGKYLDPAAHNQTAEKGVSYDASIESSLSDVKPADKKAAPASSGGSLDQPAIQKPSVKTTDATGSVANTEPAKAPAKVLDKTGSVEDVPVKTVETKPAVETKGTSTEDVPVKPAAEKKASVEEGSTKG